MSKLLDDCLKTTGRSYPDGYGFALAYLKDDPSVDDLKAMKTAADSALFRWARKRIGHGNDAVRYAEALNDGIGWPRWLVEAAQLVLADALAGGRKSKATLKRWGHPGY